MSRPNRAAFAFLRHRERHHRFNIPVPEHAGRSALRLSLAIAERNTMRVRLTRNELLAISDHTEHGFKTKLRRDQWGLAYGGRGAAARAWYGPEDAVVVHLVSTLAKAYDATTGARMTRAFADVVLITIAKAEADFTVDAHFAVVDFVGKDGQRAYLACGARDTTPDTIAAELAKSPPARAFVAERVITINVSHLIRIVRTNAARIGIDLIAPFLPPPESAEFLELMAPYAELPGGIVEMRAAKKRDAIAGKIGARVRARAMGQGAVGRKVASRTMRTAA